MGRYIDADAFREEWLENGVNKCVYDTNAVLDSIDAQPTADVEEVKHAFRTLNVGHRSYCSNCGGLAVCEKYCSLCGAKMDGGGKK